MNDKKWINDFKNESKKLALAIDSLGKFITEKPHPESIPSEQIKELDEALHDLGSGVVRRVFNILNSFYEGD